MIWKDVEGYEGLYQVSNEGQVRSLDRVVTQQNRTGYAPLTRTYQGKTLSPKLDAGYFRLQLSDRVRRKTVAVHILVAQAFCEGYFEGAVVNHKDGNKLNNNANNLEWVTVAENNRHAYKTGLKDACLATGIAATGSQWVISIFKDGIHIKDVCGVAEFDAFGKPLGLKYSGMLNFFRGTVKQYKGHTFSRRLKNETAN